MSLTKEFYFNQINQLEELELPIEYLNNYDKESPNKRI